MFTPNYAVIPRRQSRAPWWWTSAASVPRCQGQKSGLPGPPRNKRYKVGPSPQIQSQLAPKRGVCVCVCGWVCVGVCACVRAFPPRGSDRGFQSTVVHTRGAATVMVIPQCLPAVLCSLGLEASKLYFPGSPASLVLVGIWWETRGSRKQHLGPHRSLGRITHHSCHGDGVAADLSSQARARLSLFSSRSDCANVPNSAR